jgi:hypothetical protein
MLDGLWGVILNIDSFLGGFLEKISGRKICSCFFQLYCNNREQAKRERLGLLNERQIV